METLQTNNPSVPKARDFDFEAHLRKAIEEYQTIRPLYVDFSEAVKLIVKEELCSRFIRVHSIEARAKTSDSFLRKAAFPSCANPGMPKFREPLRDLTDLAGIRIITFFPKTIAEVDEVLQSEFDVRETDNKSDSLLAEGRFGYASVHYLVRLKPNRTELAEYGRFKDLVAEIQVRTILQHAWAEIEHDIQYKSVDAMPADIRRRFTSLAGLLELADREFQAIHDEDEKRHNNVANHG